ncbi:MAG: site-2 protease family protein [Nocardioidaceae bacterium]
MTGLERDKSPVVAGADNTPHGGARNETPFGVGIPLGHWHGVPVRAHWSVLVALALFAYVLATSTLPTAKPGQPTAGYWVAGAVTATVLFVTLLVHELAHAITARHYGVGVRTISLWMLGGLTELDSEPSTPRADGIVALSGPLASLGLGVFFAVLSGAVGGSGLVATSLAWLAGVSVLLALFNLLPGAPLDGGRVLSALLWWRSHDRARAADRAARTGRMVGIALIALGLFETTFGSYAGLWIVLVGWFIMNGAASERYAVRVEKLRGLTAGDVMTPTPTVAANWSTVEQFLAGLSPENAAQPVFPLVDLDGRLTGVVSLATLERLSPAQRSAVRMGGVVVRSRAPLTVTTDTAVPDLVHTLRVRGGLAVVVDAGRPVGLVTDRDLHRATQLAELGWVGGKASAAAAGPAPS